MAVLHLLLAEGGKATLWNPTIIGVLTVLCAVGLFCGSTYLLLGTNLGARLGFLVAAAGLSGFLVLLTTLWLTTPGNATGNSDLDPPHGNSAGQPAPSQPFNTLGIASSTDYLLTFPGAKSYQYIDKTKNFFWHRHRYAALEICLARINEVTGSPATDAKGNPVCDPLKPTHFAILSYDYGSVRKPVVFYWLFSLIFFGLSLLGLHWWEKDERARKRAALAPVPATSE
jgi:hypothetical protein